MSNNTANISGEASAKSMNIPFLSLERITAMHGEEIQKAVAEVVKSGWYLQGKCVSRFEKEYASYTKEKHCIGVANGLEALTLIIRGYKELGILHDGDEIIVPANTYIATILSITENNLVPVLVEPRIENFQIDDSLIEEKITPRTKAVMIVHLYGYNAYTEKIGDVCRKHSFLLLQDCAQAHGLKNTSCDCPVYDDTLRGASAHSFYPGKNLGALGDAGAVTTDDDKLAETVRTLGNYGSSKKYVFPLKGVNSRLDEVQAAVLSVKLKYLDEDNKRRRHIAERYAKEINNDAITLPEISGVHHIFPILCQHRDDLQEYLHSKGIGTMIHYPIPPHQQECYKEWNSLSFPITEQIHREELSIPLNQSMTEEEVDYIIEAVNSKY